jgi:CRP-like cAMP-binding protein
MRTLVSSDAWATLTAQGRPRLYQTGDVLVRQGELGTHVVVLIDGRVKAICSDEDGAEVLLAIRGPGDIINEMAVIDAGLTPSTVSALTPCLARVVLANEFLAFVSANDLALPLLRYATARRRESEQIRVELSTLPVSHRLIRMLLRLVEAMDSTVDGAVVVELGLPQEDLAHAIGASRSQVAAELARLRADGIVATGRCRLLIQDPGRLRAIDARIAAG